MNKKELLTAYRVIGWAMNENKRASYNQAFVTVKNWLANCICDQYMEDENVLAKNP